MPVLPFCILNVIIAYLVTLAKKYAIYIAFSSQGHASMGLLVSFLVLNKLYLALDRYMLLRGLLGTACSSLRELHQCALVFTTRQSSKNKHKNSDDTNAKDTQEWRQGVRNKISDILESTIRLLKDDDKAAYLSQNECQAKAGDDPMVYAQSLRAYIYNTDSVELELMEKITLIGKIDNYLAAYRELLKIASTPLPFPMVQMGRTFLFLWIFTMPLALAGLEVQLSAVLIFVFFLTYGYIGLELVSMTLLYPTGDDINDLNITGIKEATLLGLDNDATLVGTYGQLHQSTASHTNIVSGIERTASDYHALTDTPDEQVHDKEMVQP